MFFLTKITVKQGTSTGTAPVCVHNLPIHVQVVTPLKNKKSEAKTVIQAYI